MPYINLNKVNLYYEEVGINQPIIFLHNAFSRGIIAFSAQIGMLQSKYRCILPDLRGHGRSTCDNLEWTIPELADDIIELMDKLNIDKANIVGFSMGGGIALYIAARYPNRVKSFITIGAASKVAEGLKSNADNFEHHIVENEEDKEFINLLINNHIDAHKGDWKTFGRVSANNWRNYPNLTERELGLIRCPAMFISGANDVSIKKEDIKILGENVKNSKIEIIDGCGHGPHLVTEKPVEVTKIIDEFLKEATIMEDR